MTSWTNFALYLSLIYLVYYSINLGYDLLLSKGTNPDSADGPTVFELTEQAGPIDASAIFPDDYPTDISQGDLLHSGPLSASGGVSLAALFTLAAEDAILFTKQIAA